MHWRILLTYVAVIFSMGFAPHRANAEPLPLSRLLTHANLTAHIGQWFYVYGGEKGLRKVVSLEMVEVSERKQDARTEQFFVRFRGPDDPVLSKSVYTFEHSATGDRFQLFLEPEGKDTKGQYYRTVFNLLR